jgi:ABC-type arginine transport system ATPase subunit
VSGSGSGWGPERAREGEVQERLLDNPFYVLELAPDCSRAEVERSGQKLLAMLELDLAGAGRYPTPFGSGRRDAAKVREAMAQLRDPQRRLFHELWVLAPPWTGEVPSAEAEVEPGFYAALSALGWRS